MNDSNTLLSFVIPCYRSEHTIEKVIQEIIELVGSRRGYDYEIICVNDCSPDNVYDVLKKISEDNSKIKIVNLVKNAGKHSAVMAGYSFVKGDYVINLDDDYQSPMNRLWDLLDPLLSDECDIATANYTIKKEAGWKVWGSNFNMWISRIMLDKPKGLRLENFNAMKRFVVDEVIKYKNPYPFLEGLYLRVTRRIMTIDMAERDRSDDNKSGFTFWKSVSLFVNGLTNFSPKPLRIALIIGTIFACSGFIYGLAIIIKKLLIPATPVGWSSIMAVLLFSSGTNMLILGLIGEYVGRIYICLNDPPQYVIRNTINIEVKQGDTPNESGSCFKSGQYNS